MIVQYPKPIRKPRLKRKATYQSALRKARGLLGHPTSKFGNSTASIRKPKRKINKPKKIKVVPLPKLKKILWKLLREKILKRDGGKCVSCGMMGNQCGHYVKKSICNLKWQYHVDNLGCQCVRCNVFLNGNPVEYRKWMVKRYGVDFVEWLEDEYNKPLPMDFNPREYIEGLIKIYTV